MMGMSKKDFCESLIGNIYKILPIYEGEDINKAVCATPEVAYSNYLNQLVTLEAEVEGAYEYYQDDKIFRMLFIIKGMKNLKVGEHAKVRTCVFDLIKICKSVV